MRGLLLFIGRGRCWRGGAVLWGPSTPMLALCHGFLAGGDAVVASCLPLPSPDTLAACTGELNTELEKEQLERSSHSVKLYDVCRV